MLVDGYPVKYFFLFFLKDFLSFTRFFFSQQFVTPQWGFVKPFSLTAEDARTNVDGSRRKFSLTQKFDGLYFDPGAPPVLDFDSPTKDAYVYSFFDRCVSIRCYVFYIAIIIIVFNKISLLSLNVRQ